MDGWRDRQILHSDRWMGGGMMGCKGERERERERERTKEERGRERERERTRMGEMER